MCQGRRVGIRGATSVKVKESCERRQEESSGDEVMLRGKMSGRGEGGKGMSGRRKRGEGE